jgi:hypothetical protein
MRARSTVAVESTLPETPLGAGVFLRVIATLTKPVVGLTLALSNHFIFLSGTGL